MSNNPSTISLIVPTYNEKENLAALVQRIHAALGSQLYEIIVVDDDSRDGTAELAESLSHQYPIRVIRRKGEKGVASAIATGFKQAEGQVLGVMYAGLQHPPERIPDLLKEIENGADVAIGSRYAPGGEMKGCGLTRRLVSRGATMMARMLLPSIKKVRDPLSGFFLFRREVIDGVELKPARHTILIEVLTKGRSKTVSEVACTFTEREHRGSKLGLSELPGYAKHLLKLASKERGVRRLFQFGIVGVTGTGVNEGVLWLLAGPAGLNHLVSAIFSIEASIISNFILNDSWTFRDRREGSISTRALKYHVVAAAGAIMNWLVYLGLTEKANIYYLVSMLLGILVSFVWNFALSMLWAWRKHDADDAEDAGKAKQDCSAPHQ